MGQTGQSEAIHSPEAWASTVVQIDEARYLIDGRGLHSCNLMLTKRFAHDVEATRQRRIAKGAFPFARRSASNRGDE